jgi:hypothetical protein
MEGLPWGRIVHPGTQRLTLGSSPPARKRTEERNFKVFCLYRGQESLHAAGRIVANMRGKTQAV